MRKLLSLLIGIWLFLLGIPVVQADTILFVPLDDRPVCLDYVVDTVKATGTEILVPPTEYLSSRYRKGNPEALWQWLLEHSRQADALVISADAMIYGGLVDSRTHQFDTDTLQKRLQKFEQLQAKNPDIRMYVFGTVTRTPRASSGGTEPKYYETFGPAIFRLTALQDKEETVGLTREEKKTLRADMEAIPPEFLIDWKERRKKNLDINVGLIDFTKRKLFSYFLLGRDDTAAFSQSHRELRYLTTMAERLPANEFRTIPGADELGIIMVNRAYNDLTGQIPIVRVNYAPGAGAATVPSYEDQPFGKSVIDHVLAAGGLVFSNPVHPDMVIAVNTPESGRTLEAESAANTKEMTAGKYSFVDSLESRLRAGEKVAIADIAFANGGDNALLHELSKRKLLDKFQSYAGWNTASNTLGYTLSQGLLASHMNEASRKRLLAVRYLDDWAYQANIRDRLKRTILYPQKGSAVQLNERKSLLTKEAEIQLRLFAGDNLPWVIPEKIHVFFPWNRMFELQVNLEW